MDWKTFISQYDIVYETPPSCWEDGFLLGNGHLGAVFYANRALQWVVNRSDIIDGRTHDVRETIPPDEAEQMVRDGASFEDFRDRETIKSKVLGLGPKSCCLLTMDIATPLGPDMYSRMSLHDATLYLQLDRPLCHPRVESFMHATKDVLMISVRDISPLCSFMTKLYFSRPYDVELPEAMLHCENARIVLKMSMPGCGDYVAAVQAIPRESNAYRDRADLMLRPKYRPPHMGQVRNEVAGRFGMIDVTGDFDVFITVASDRESEDPLGEVHERLDSVVTQSYEQQKKSHAAWWHNYWQKSWVELDDKGLEQLFYSSLYLLGSNYRRAPIPGLLGLLYGPSTGPIQLTPWLGDLHLDLNTQCPFFPVHALNHSELYQPFLDTYESFLPTARQLASRVCGVSGAHFDMCFNTVGKSLLGGVGRFRFFYAGSYIGLMHCLCWRYRRDVEQLRTQIYPFLKEILEFYLNIMKQDEDGTYHLWPCHACELDLMDVSDAVFTMSTLEVCLQTALEAADIFNDSGAYVACWKDMLDNLPAYSTGTDAKGRDVVLDGKGIDPNHHVGPAGCLYPVYPCGQVDALSGPEDVRLYSDTLDSVEWKTAAISYACDQGFYFRWVWPCFFHAMTALRLGRTDDFWHVYMPMFIRCYSKPNGAVSHNAAVVCSSASSERNLDNIPDESLVDVDEMMPKVEPWHYSDSASPNIKAKEWSVPFIEGSGDYLTMITETLLQSQNGLIRVFPGWPEDKNAQFVDLIAEGNIAVSSKVTMGEVDFIKLTSRNSEPVETAIVSPWTRKIETLSLDVNRDVVLTANGRGEVLDICQEPLDYEEAKPRKLYEDDNATLWIGRRARMSACSGASEDGTL